jgi:hypothetical protein
MPEKKKESGKYIAGSLILLGLMIVAVILGWYGLELAKQSLANTTTISAPPTTRQLNQTSITVSSSAVSTSTAKTSNS